MAPEQAKQEVITIRVSSMEKQELIEKARQQKMALSRWVRKVLLSN